MQIVAESEFPRGKRVKQPTVPNKPKKRKSDQLLTNDKKHHKKKKVSIEEFKLNIEPVDLQLTKVFNSKTLRDGMVVLGCITEITDMTLVIQLPNMINCNITINSISDHLTNVLTRQAEECDLETLTVLQEIFNVGQLVPVKIGKKSKIILPDFVEVKGTLSPREINEDRMHYSFVKGTTIWVNIVSELDHGYELSAGVPNCRIFLPFKNIDDDKKYRVGEPLYCIVHKYQTVDNVTTLTVSAKREHLNKCQLDNLNVNVLIPGTKVEFFIEENQTNGVKGKVFATYDGFIDKTFQFGLKKYFKEATTIWAYVVFIEPITGIIYLTLRGLDSISAHSEFEYGDLLKAPVKMIAPHGIYLDLGDNRSGFVSNQRLSTMNDNMDLNDFIESKYKIGSQHKCRILNYNLMQQVYICAVEPHIVNEKVFSIKDLKFGEKYTATIRSLCISNGLMVAVGQVKGYISKIHLFKGQIKTFERIKEKFKKGKQLVVKLLSINDKGNVLFTAKPDLMKSDDCLTDIKDAVKGQKYIGYITKILHKYVEVGFYNGISGSISCDELNYGIKKPLSDLRKYFYLGQIVHVWVRNKTNNRLELSLSPPLLKIGRKYQGRIVEKKRSKLYISIDGQEGDNTIAFLPLQHLSRHPLLSKYLYEALSCGKKIFKSICIDDKLQILSRREYLVTRGRKYKRYKFENLRENMLIRATLESKHQNKISVVLPLKDYKKSTYIGHKQLTVEEINRLKIGQSILTRITRIYDIKKGLDLAIIHRSLNNVKYTMRLLMSYIDDIELIRRLRKSTQYQVATRVQCVVKDIWRNNITVVLPDGKINRVPLWRCDSNININQQIEAIILGYNPCNDQYFVSLRKMDRLTINPQQDGVLTERLKSYTMARILLRTNYYALGLLTDPKCNRQLVYLPVNLNENDNRTEAFYKKRSYLKVVILKKRKGRLFGIPIQLDRHLIGLMDVKQKSKRINKTNIEKVMQVERITTNENSIKEEEEEVEPVNVAPVLSSVDKFYIADEPKLVDTVNDEDIEDKPIKPTTTLSKAEWKKQEEERIRRIEQELADPTATPQSAEQFERLLLANPNSVELWLKYIAMLISATELSKARAVGEQALEKINPTMVEEKMQIWIALLNMENLYGTRESFDELFERAIKYNETFDIYIKVIKMLANSGKITEMEEKIKKLRNKEKQNVRMWLEIGQVYYNLNKYREARNIQEAALKSIIDKKRQLEIILRFGIMEFQYGELEHAVQHFETVLDIYSRKINMWTIYIDQLIKKKEYEMARRIFDRAIRQKFPVKNMRTLYQKFISFEEQYGNVENVRKIKQMAKDYVDKISQKS